MLLYSLLLDYKVFFVSIKVFWFNILIVQNNKEINYDIIKYIKVRWYEQSFI